MNASDLQIIKRRYNVVGNCDALNRALDVALQVAPTDLSVLVIGESGVGKEILPRIIHDNSPRKREKYFAINCGSIPEGTIDSELFGHEKGAFTGAIGESEGYFGVANKGTIFLDEVGELPLATQARLLRVLETGEYIRVGGQKIMKTDVRIVAATNVNMRKAVSEGRFREDLYYRLNTIPVQMPPLRERGEDILLLFRLFAMQMADKYNLPRISLSEDAMQMMLKYKWPGNVRQLKNITEQMSVLSKDRVITAEALSHFIPQDIESTQLVTVGAANSDSQHSYESEREMLYKILYELREHVTELRREVDELKSRFNSTPHQPRELQAPDHRSSSTQMPALISRHSGHNDVEQQMPNVQDAVAEEIPNGVVISGADDGQSFYVQSQEENYDVHSGPEENLNIKDVNRQMLEKALEKNGGNRKKAALELGISDRTLYRRIKQYGLDK